MSESRWRNIAAPIIAEVLKRFPQRGKEQDEALKAAYPFGERKYHPYKIWLDEIRQQQNGRKVVMLDPAKKLVFGSSHDPYGES